MRTTMPAFGDVMNISPTPDENTPAPDNDDHVP